jgi:tRNA pseudouridine38-40 synthase
MHNQYFCFILASDILVDINREPMPGKFRYFIQIAYDGTGFYGWQRQPGRRTVQQTLDEALSLMLRKQIGLTGAGRTDTGVHAREFFAHVDLDTPLTGAGRERLVFRLNSFLGGEISIFRIFPVKEDAHARFSAVSRTYRYCIARRPDPFRRPYTYLYNGPLDIIKMNLGAGMIAAASDFTSFSKVDTDTATNICSVKDARWEQEGSELVFTITADRFLRNMVRAIVGTLLQVGKGKVSPDDLKKIIDGKDRCLAGDSAPAKGLILAGIEYPEEIFQVDERTSGQADKVTK